MTNVPSVEQRVLEFYPRHSGEPGYIRQVFSSVGRELVVHTLCAMIESGDPARATWALLFLRDGVLRLDVPPGIYANVRALSFSIDEVELSQHRFG